VTLEAAKERARLADQVVVLADESAIDCRRDELVVVNGIRSFLVRWRWRRGYSRLDRNDATLNARSIRWDSHNLANSVAVRHRRPRFSCLVNVTESGKENDPQNKKYGGYPVQKLCDSCGTVDVVAFKQSFTGRKPCFRCGVKLTNVFGECRITCMQTQQHGDDTYNKKETANEQHPDVTWWAAKVLEKRNR